MSIKKRVNALMIVLGLILCSPAFALNLEFSAFGDMSLGFTFGNPADQNDLDLFQNFGTDPDPVNLQRGFGIVGTDFVVLAELTDRLNFLSEVNLQLGRGGSSDIELDMERNFLDYRIKEWFNIQAGSFFTPIGFFNRTLYSRAWLMTSIQIPDIFEEELNLAPTHDVGVNVYGTLPTFGAHSLNYAVAVTNGRGPTPDKLIMGRDPTKNKQVSAMLEWVVPNVRDFRIGLSGWTGIIDSYDTMSLPFGAPTDISTLEQMQLRETGFQPHLVVYSRPFNLIVEYVHAQHRDLLGNLSEKTFTLQGVMAELSLNLLDGTLHPYVRYDSTDLPKDGGPYYPLREEGGFVTRHFIPEFQAVMVGLTYDLYAFNRIKLEYSRHFDGPRPENGIAIQTAFGF